MPCFSPRYLFILLALLLAGSAPFVFGNDKEGHLPSYRLQPMDLVKVQVFQETDLDRELRISKDSSIMLPLIGQVDLRNRTVQEAEKLIGGMYEKDYLVNPQINLTVVEYAPRSVNVLGAVNAPSAVPIPPERELTLVDAIARCGGFSRLANRTHISLTRTFPDGRSENFTINADQVMAGDAEHRWSLMNGDVIYVSERVL